MILSPQRLGNSQTDVDYRYWDCIRSLFSSHHCLAFNSANLSRLHHRKIKVHPVPPTRCPPHCRQTWMLRLWKRSLFEMHPWMLPHPLRHMCLIQPDADSRKACSIPWESSLDSPSPTPTWSTRNLSAGKFISQISRL